MAELLSCVVEAQRWSEPPVTLRASFLLVRIECDRITGMGLSESANEAIDQVYSGRMVEA